MLFAGAAAFGALVVTLGGHSQELLGSPTFALSRALVSNIVSIYAVKMAAVFMIVTSTLVIRTGFAARWMAFLGYALPLPLLFGSRFLDWEFLVFPLWVFLISFHILADNLRRRPEAAP
jgi:hypothetical protein